MMHIWQMKLNFDQQLHAWQVFLGNIPIVQKHLGTLALLGLAIVMVVFLVNQGWKHLTRR